jgi:hypothetical protein
LLKVSIILNFGKLHGHSLCRVHQGASLGYTARDRGVESEEAGDRIGDKCGGLGTWIDEGNLDVAASLPPVDEGRAPTTEREVAVVTVSGQETTKSEWNSASDGREEDE